uniref:Uncharacterized protein n=1 Tax=Arundo donax TaxID=35708 RepID=A0A0A9H6M1_ARUDO
MLASVKLAGQCCSPLPWTARPA